MGNQFGVDPSGWNNCGSSCLSKESALFRDRLVLVPRHARASDWLRASRMAGTRRSLHIFAADRPLYCAYLGGNRPDALMAISTVRPGRCWYLCSWGSNLARLATDFLLAQ